MPLTMPSTAWSSATSSKMMFAALPPSSSVRRLPVPASSRWIAFPTSVEPVNAILSTPGCLTSAAPVRQVDVARLLDRLAAVQRLEHRELAGALLQDAGDPEEVLGALGRPDRRPAVLERLARGLDGEVDVRFGRLRDLGERLLCRRVDRRVG